jgi:iron complex outermembrane receptor protein
MVQSISAAKTAALAAFALAVAPQASADEPAATTLLQVDILARGSSLDLAALPNTRISVTADVIARTINAFTPEDTLRYLPSLTVRQRHIGDTQSPLATRTSGLGGSARSLIYVDGVLVSTLLGNNNSTASPKWGLVSTEAIERVDVLYGPFAAAYAGNSIGAVVAFTTRMPQGREATAQLQGQSQAFSKYGDDRRYGTTRFAAGLGDRLGPAAFRLSYNHLDSRGHPLGYATAQIPAANSVAGAPAAGGYRDATRAGVPILVLGSTGIEHQRQDNLSGRLTYDPAPNFKAAYTFGLFGNHTDATVRSYLTGAGAAPVFAGALNIGGRAFNIPNTAFSNGVYRTEELLLAQGVSATLQGGGALEGEFVATRFDYLKSRQRIPSGALPAAFGGGPGSLASMDGTGWSTVDAKGSWRPPGGADAQVVTFGLHEDRFKLNSPRYALSDWISAPRGATQAFSRGRTRTRAAWAQAATPVGTRLKATVGLRLESWRAYGGLNYSAAPVLDRAQPRLQRKSVSPKAVLAFDAGDGWVVKVSAGAATRFPTVTELYQAVAVGAALQVPNPDLKPERAVSEELSVERVAGEGSVRIALFDETISNALLSQTAPLPAGSTTLASFVQNVDRTRVTGIELVASKEDVLLQGLDVSGWVTYARARVEADEAFAAAVGKRLPGVPRWRASMVIAYAATPRLDLTLAARNGDRTFGTIDNTDTYANTFQGFGAYLVADAKARYRLSDHLTASLGVNNIGARDYFLFHPFPQRTVVADLSWRY